MATSRFENVLTFVSNSKLNFSIYKTLFSAQISLKNSFAKYSQVNEALADDTNKNKNNERITGYKSKIVDSDENRKDSEERENLQAIIEKQLTVIDDLKDHKKDLETKLKESKKDPKRVVRGLTSLRQG